MSTKIPEYRIQVQYSQMGWTSSGIEHRMQEKLLNQLETVSEAAYRYFLGDETDSQNVIDPLLELYAHDEDSLHCTLEDDDGHH